MKPKFLAIGPPKTGSTWLYQVLCKHPEIALTPIKEIRFFWELQHFGEIGLQRKMIGKHVYLRKKRKYIRSQLGIHFANLLSGKLNVNSFRWDWHYFTGKQTFQWYLKLFNETKITGDITPKYAELNEESISFIRACLPDVKIIIGLRDPIERSWSRSKMVLLKDRGISDPQKVSDEEFYKSFRKNPEFESNNYVEIIKRWKKIFPKENILIYFYEELVDDPEDLLKRICNFIGVSEIESKESSRKYNEGIEYKLPDKYLTDLIELNKENLVQIANYFDQKWPQFWLEKYIDH